MNVTNFYYISALYVLVVRSPMPTVGLSSLCIRLNEMVAAADANLGKLNGRDKSLHKMSGVDERAGEKGILLALAACAGDPVFGGGDGERPSGVDHEGTWEGERHAPPSHAILLPLRSQSRWNRRQPQQPKVCYSYPISLALSPCLARVCIVELVSSPSLPFSPPPLLRLRLLNGIERGER